MARITKSLYASAQSNAGACQSEALWVAGAFNRNFENRVGLAPSTGGFNFQTVYLKWREQETKVLKSVQARLLVAVQAFKAFNDKQSTV